MGRTLVPTLRVETVLVPLRGVLNVNPGSEFDLAPYSAIIKPMNITGQLISIAITLAVAVGIYFLLGGRHVHPLIKIFVLTRFSALMVIARAHRGASRSGCLSVAQIALAECLHPRQ